MSPAEYATLACAALVVVFAAAYTVVSVVRNFYRD